MSFDRIAIIVCLPLLASTPASAADITVTMAGGAYQPAKISAAVGDTIRFRNDDDADHNVFVPTVGHALDLGKQEPGQEAVLTLGKSGTFDVECVFHPGMLTIVEVK